MKIENGALGNHQGLISDGHRENGPTDTWQAAIIHIKTVKHKLKTKGSLDQLEIVKKEEFGTEPLESCMKVKTEARGETATTSSRALR